jgi:hypothetical protein
VGVRDLTAVLGASAQSWTQRRTRLQGWRGDDAERADAAVVAQRFGPAACAVGAFAGAWLRSPTVLAVFAGTALVGTFAPNHPFEAIYNRWAVGHGRTALPHNPAAKRLGCAIGLVFLGTSAIAFAVGAPTVGLALALVLGVTALFVAMTGVCVPSILFTLLWGAERASRPGLLQAVQKDGVPSR